MIIMLLPNIKEMPKTCVDCPIVCRLPAKKSSYEITIKNKYTKMRHEDCPLRETDIDK